MAGARRAQDTVEAMTDTITITGPGVARLVDAAVGLYRDVLGGRWGAVVDATPQRWADPTEARAAFDALAVGTATHRADQLSVTADGDDAVHVVGTRAALCEAVDLWMRVQLGQLDRLCFDVAYMSPLLELRGTHAAPGAWPAHPHSSWGVHSREVDVAVRVAYDIWKGLGGGMVGRGQIGRTVRVTVEPAGR